MRPADNDPEELITMRPMQFLFYRSPLIELLDPPDDKEILMKCPYSVPQQTSRMMLLSLSILYVCAGALAADGPAVRKLTHAFLLIQHDDIAGKLGCASRKEPDHAKIPS
jgi:hypothetical protein